MNIACILRTENAGLVDEMCRRGHTVYMPWDHAVEFRRILNQPVQPIEIKENRVTLDDPFKYGEHLPGVIDTFLDAHEKHAFDAFVTWTDAPAVPRTAVLAMHHVGVPTFEVTHGAFNTYRQGHFECESFVDYILAPGQEEADFRTFYGSKAKVIVTGKPTFDWLAYANMRELRNTVRTAFGLPERRPLIVYGTTWRHPFSTWERDADKGERNVLEAHMNLQAVCAPFLVVKLRAGETAAARKWRDDLAGLGVVEYAVAAAEPRLVLPGADLVVSHKSSLLVEALLMDIPAIGFDFRERNDHRFYEGKGIEWVEKREDLLPAMARCLLDRTTKDRLAAERQTAATYFNGPNDGHATWRCVDTIEDIVNQKEALTA